MIYNDLLELATIIYEGVLVGTVTDLLMLDVVPMPVGIRVFAGGKLSNVIPVLETCCTIPTKENVEISRQEYPRPVQIEVLQGDFQRAVGQRLWNLKTINRFTIADAVDSASSVKISVDVGADGYFKIISIK